MVKPKISVLRTTPSTVVEDYGKIMDLAEYKKYLPKKYETILKLNLSWTLFYPACSSPPWQLDGVLKKMFDDGYKNLHPVENKTVVTKPWEGARQNKWLPVLKKFNIPFEPLTEVKWKIYKPKFETLGLKELFGEKWKIPKMFLGKNVVHFPTVKCVHPDTNIFLSDGSLVKIQNFVDEIHKKNKVNELKDGDLVSDSKKTVKSLNSDGRLINATAIKFWKTPVKENVIYLKTKTSKEIKVSKQHPFLTQRGWVKAKELNVEDRIAIVRSLAPNVQDFTEIEEINPDKGTIAMKILTSEDLAWDHISELKEIKSDVDYFYDLSVEDHENFIGNGIIVHNTHGHTTMTGSIKNAFGGLLTERRHHSHKIIDEILVDLLEAQQDIHTGIFSVMDGTTCGNGAGPRTMTPVTKNLILGGGDCVALDSISAHMMGFDPMKIKHLRMAHDKGLGCADIDQIDIVGLDVRKFNFGFRTGRSPVVYFDQVFRKKYPAFEPILFHTPLFKLCIFGSEFYHDYLWYPIEGKRNVRKYMKTLWGKKFKSY